MFAAGLFRGSPLAPTNISAAGGLSVDKTTINCKDLDPNAPKTIVVTTSIPTHISFTATFGCTVTPASQTSVPLVLSVVQQWDRTDPAALINTLKGLALSGRAAESTATFGGGEHCHLRVRRNPGLLDHLQGPIRQQRHGHGDDRVRERRGRPLGTRRRLAKFARRR
ncbi:MAG: hypothetical protein AB7T32_06790 [Dehalococcoidia bacterium]